MAGKLVLAVVRRPQFFTRGLFTGLVECLHAVVAGFLQSKHSSRPREVLQSLLDLIWEVTLAKQ